MSALFKLFILLLVAAAPVLSANADQTMPPHPHEFAKRVSALMRDMDEIEDIEGNHPRTLSTSDNIRADMNQYLNLLLADYLFDEKAPQPTLSEVYQEWVALPDAAFHPLKARILYDWGHLDPEQKIKQAPEFLKVLLNQKIDMQRVSVDRSQNRAIDMNQELFQILLKNHINQLTVRSNLVLYFLIFGKHLDTHIQQTLSQRFPFLDPKKKLTIEQQSILHAFLRTYSGGYFIYYKNTTTVISDEITSAAAPYFCLFMKSGGFTYSQTLRKRNISLEPHMFQSLLMGTDAEWIFLDLIRQIKQAEPGVIANQLAWDAWHSHLKKSLKEKFSSVNSTMSSDELNSVLKALLNVSSSKEDQAEVKKLVLKSNKHMSAFLKTVYSDFNQANQQFVDQLFLEKLLQKAIYYAELSEDLIQWAMFHPLAFDSIVPTIITNSFAAMLAINPSFADPKWVQAQLRMIQKLSLPIAFHNHLKNFVLAGFYYDQIQWHETLNKLNSKGGQIKSEANFIVPTSSMQGLWPTIQTNTLEYDLASALILLETYLKYPTSDCHLDSASDTLRKALQSPEGPVTNITHTRTDIADLLTKYHVAKARFSIEKVKHRIISMGDFEREWVQRMGQIDAIHDAGLALDLNVHFANLKMRLKDLPLIPNQIREPLIKRMNERLVAINEKLAFHSTFDCNIALQDIRNNPDLRN